MSDWIYFDREPSGKKRYKGECVNCKKEVISRMDRIRNGLRFCIDCKGCKYKDFEKNNQAQ